MPFPVDAETEEAVEEARSILGSFITQLISIVRQLIRWVSAVVSKVVEWAGEHPLAITLLVANICIWVSP
ncbi:MAG: hypothetical protein QW734_07885 [Candidatus Bathyarchaeia archaeon]